MAPLPEPIAVVGTACRFPGGSDDPSKLWELLKNPRDLSKKIPRSRFNTDGFYHPEATHHGTTNATKSYFLDSDVAHFDAGFFSIREYLTRKCAREEGRVPFKVASVALMANSSLPMIHQLLIPPYQNLPRPMQSILSNDSCWRPCTMALAPLVSPWRSCVALRQPSTWA